MRLRRMLTVSSMTLATVLALTAPAVAHTPVLLDETDKIPWVAPLAVDGTDDFTFFGALPRKGAVRSFQLALQAGQPLNATLAIPDLTPENTLAVADLPRVFLFAPNGSFTVLVPTARVPFRDPDLGLDLLILRSYSSTAVTGIYSVVVTGRAPNRFVVATGVESEAFHGILRGSVATEDQIRHWYATAP